MEQHPQPLFILAPPRSFTSLVSALIGQHPQTYGLPELNLFMAATMQQFWNGTDEDGSHKAPHWPIMRHGLLRTVAQLYGGEQNIDSIAMAYRWISHRSEQGTGEVFRELCEKIGPLIPVEKSPGYLGKPIYLERLLETFPDARFIHLLRHPVGQGESVLNATGGKLVLMMVDSVDHSGEKPIVDPQIMWHDSHVQIHNFLQQVPKENQLRLRGEDFLTDMDKSLRKVCRWLGVKAGKAELEAMKHPEDSPYACVGPINARLGNDINFLENPKVRATRVKEYDMMAPLSWRPDNQPLMPEVRALAKKFGYR